MLIITVSVHSVSAGCSHRNRLQLPESEWNSPDIGSKSLPTNQKQRCVCPSYSTTNKILREPEQHRSKFYHRPAPMSFKWDEKFNSISRIDSFEQFAAKNWITSGHSLYLRSQFIYNL